MSPRAQLPTRAWLTPDRCSSRHADSCPGVPYRVLVRDEWPDPGATTCSEKLARCHGTSRSFEKDVNPPSRPRGPPVIPIPNPKSPIPKPKTHCGWAFRFDLCFGFGIVFAGIRPVSAWRSRQLHTLTRSSAVRTALAPHQLAVARSVSGFPAPAGPQPAAVDTDQGCACPGCEVQPLSTRPQELLLSDLPTCIRSRYERPLPSGALEITVWVSPSRRLTPISPIEQRREVPP